ncbi:hypothetical protein GCM10009798_22460 [Nocardioides panacihumi]|uniref:CARDB domain-containing protein n=1 Tax=Nocardioides panacihumi TaxID=400774 RepID=A0ABN2R224_9ACTN
MNLTRRGPLVLLACLATALSVIEPASAATARPDLKPTGATLGQTRQVVGGTLSVIYSARNAGTRAAGGSTTRIYLTTVTSAASRQPSDRLLGSGALPRLQARASSGSRRLTVTIPGATRPATYGVRVCLDDPSRVRERRESDNCRLTATRLTVTARPTPPTIPPAGAPDLTVTSATASTGSLTEGSALTVTYAGRNTGPQPAGASTTRVYLTTDETSPGKLPADIRLRGASPLPALAARSDAPAITAGVRVPYGIPAGSYAVRVCVDDLTAVAESDETNNCRLAPAHLTVAATPGDLEVQSYGDAAAWLPDSASLTMLKLFCGATTPPQTMSLTAAVSSVRSRLAATVGGSALDMVAASPLAADAVSAQRLAGTALSQSSPGLALAAMLRAHDLDPQDGGHLVGLAALANSSGMPNEALAFLDAADRLEYRDPAMGIPVQAIAHNERGQALLMTGRPAAARTELSAALVQSPMLSEAARGLAAVEACAGQDAKAIRDNRIGKVRRQTRVPDDVTPEGPEPNIDLTHGVATPLRHLPIAETPVQGVVMADEYVGIDEEIAGEVQADVAERQALEQRLRDVEALLTPAEVERRDDLVTLGHTVTDTADIDALWNRLTDLKDRARERREGFFGGGTGEAPYTLRTLMDDAFQACQGSPDDMCFDNEMKRTCIPELAGVHSQWRVIVGEMQTAGDAWMEAVSTRISAVAANLKDADAHRLLVLLIESLESNAYASLDQEARWWTHDEKIWADYCVTPAEAAPMPAPADGAGNSKGGCPPELKSFNIVLSLGDTSIKGNCEKITVNVSQEVMPLLKAFAEFSYDFRSGTTTYVVGTQGGLEAGGSGVSFKSGLYVTSNRNGMVDMGWRVGPEVNVGAPAVEMGVWGGDMDISFISGPFGG